MRIGMSSLTVALALTMAGCRSEQLAHDQDHIRCAVLDLQTNQVMDNLIRLRKGLPIVHLDYIHMTGTITDTDSGMVGGSETATSNGYLNIPLATLALSRVVTNAFNYSAMASQVNQLTVTAEPVNTPDVYNAYLAFLDEPAHLMETPTPPGPGEALIVRCCEAGCDDAGCSSAHGKNHKRVYFWVPCAFKDEFRKLSLYTVALRGTPVDISPDFSVTVLGFNPTDLAKAQDSASKIYRVRFKIDQPIPNDDGFMVASVKGRLYSSKNGLVVLHNDTVEVAQAGKLTDKQKTDELVLVFNLDSLGIAKLDDLVGAIATQKVGIRLNNFAPGGTQTSRLLEDIRFQLEQNRLNQIQTLPK